MKNKKFKRFLAALLVTTTTIMSTVSVPVQAFTVENASSGKETWYEETFYTEKPLSFEDVCIATTGNGLRAQIYDKTTEGHTASFADKVETEGEYAGKYKNVIPVKVTVLTEEDSRNCSVTLYVDNGRYAGNTPSVDFVPSQDSEVVNIMSDDFTAENEFQWFYDGSSWFYNNQAGEKVTVTDEDWSLQGLTKPTLTTEFSNGAKLNAEIKSNLAASVMVYSAASSASQDAVNLTPTGGMEDWKLAEITTGVSFNYNGESWSVVNDSEFAGLDKDTYTTEEVYDLLGLDSTTVSTVYTPTIHDTIIFTGFVPAKLTATITRDFIDTTSLFDLSKAVPEYSRTLTYTGKKWYENNKVLTEEQITGAGLKADADVSGLKDGDSFTIKPFVDPMKAYPGNSIYDEGYDTKLADESIDWVNNTQSFNYQQDLSYRVLEDSKIVRNEEGAIITNGTLQFVLKDSMKGANLELFRKAAAENEDDVESWEPVEVKAITDEKEDTFTILSRNKQDQYRIVINKEGYRTFIYDDIFVRKETPVPSVIINKQDITPNSATHLVEEGVINFNIANQIDVNSNSTISINGSAAVPLTGATSTLTYGNYYTIVTTVEDTLNETKEFTYELFCVGTEDSVQESLKGNFDIPVNKEGVPVKELKFDVDTQGYDVEKVSFVYYNEDDTVNKEKSVTLTSGFELTNKQLTVTQPITLSVPTGKDCYVMELTLKAEEGFAEVFKSKELKNPNNTKDFADSFIVSKDLNVAEWLDVQLEDFTEWEFATDLVECEEDLANEIFAKVPELKNDELRSEATVEFRYIKEDKEFYEILSSGVYNVEAVVRTATGISLPISFGTIIVDPSIDPILLQDNGYHAFLTEDGKLYSASGVTIKADGYKIGLLGEDKNIENINYTDSIKLDAEGTYSIYVQSVLSSRVYSLASMLYGDKGAGVFELIFDKAPINSDGLKITSVCTGDKAELKFTAEDAGFVMTHLFKKSDYADIIAEVGENAPFYHKRDALETSTKKIGYFESFVEDKVENGAFTNVKPLTISGLLAGTDYVAVSVFVDKVGNETEFLFITDFKTLGNNISNENSSSSNQGITNTVDTPSKGEVVTNPDGSKTETFTNQDGSKTEITTKLDGSKTEVTVKLDGTKSEVTTNADGSKKEVITNVDGSKVEISTAVDGSKVAVNTKVVTNSAGTKVNKVITVKTDTNGNIVSSKDESDFDLEDMGLINADGTPVKTNVVVEKNASGKTVKAEATLSVTTSSLDDLQMSASAVKQIKEAAGGKNVNIVITVDRQTASLFDIVSFFSVKDSKVTIEVNSKNVTPEKSLRLYKKSGSKYKLLKATKKTYKVDTDGNLNFKGIIDSMTGTYTYVNTTDAKKINAAIKDATKLAKSKATVKKGKKVTVKLSSKVDKDNISKVTYKAGNKKIATVTSKGVVKGKKAGKTTVTAKVTYKNGMTKTLKEIITVK